jgi:2-oxo-4-hydroxy-4-carboxy-5-ureidoimidazoline decarboxylase
MTLQELNQLDASSLQAEFFKCCGCTAWSKKLVQLMPFSSIQSLLTQSDEVWQTCNKQDALEAFSHHPKIGDLKSLEKKFASTKQWASGEQAGVDEASQQVLKQLADGNKQYEEKFGYIFIVCATGKSAIEMLEILNQRIPNSYDEELKIAMNEQNKITHIRLKKLLA